MKRTTIVRPKKVVNASTKVDGSELRKLVNALRSARDIMDEMSDETFQVVKDCAGPNFYDDVLDAVRMIESEI